jgi:hypothetical protein
MKALWSHSLQECPRALMACSVEGREVGVARRVAFDGGGRRCVVRWVREELGQ